LALDGTELIVALNAAPFAGMTQTGSTGLISAALLARHPMPMRK